jgi:hypothetical protein
MQTEPIEIPLEITEKNTAAITRVNNGMADLEKQAKSLSDAFDHFNSGFNQDYISGLERGSNTQEDFNKTLLETADQMGLSTREIRQMAEATGEFTPEQLAAAKAEEDTARKAEELAKAVAAGTMTAEEAGREYADFTKDLGTAGEAQESLSSTLEDGITKYFSYAAALEVTKKGIEMTVEAWKAEIEAAAEDQTALSQLNATIQSTGRVGEISAGQLDKMAASPLFDNAQINAAGNALSRFIEIPSEQIPSDLVVIENMAAALGTDLPSAAQKFGMEMETGRVRGEGFSKALTTQITALMTAGKVQEADAIILDNLSKKYSGQAAASLDTYNGKQQAVKVGIQELEATVGSMWLPILGTLDGALLKGINEYGTWAKLLSGQIKLDEVWAELHKGQVTPAIESGTKALGYYAEASDNVTMAQKRGTDQSTHYVEAIKDFGSQLSAITSYADIYDQHTKDMSKAEQELADLRKAGWGEHSDKIQEAVGKIKDLQTAEDQQTNKWMADMLLQKLSVNGLNDTEYKYYLDYLVRTGQMTQAAENHAKAEWDTVNAIAAMADKTITITTNHVDTYTGSGGPNPNPGGPSQHTTPKSGTGIWTDTHPPKWIPPVYWYGAGGSFVTNGPQVIGVGENGPEKVTVTPSGKPDTGGIIIHQNFYGPTTPAAVKSASQMGVLEALRSKGQ